MKVPALLAPMFLLALAGPAAAQSDSPNVATIRGNCSNGCLVLVNDSENSDIIAFFMHDGFSTAKHRWNVHWGENVFRERRSGAPLAIYPHKAWWMPISTDMPCEIRIGVNFRDRKTRKVRTGPEGNVNICGGKRTDVIFRAKEYTPDAG